MSIREKVVEAFEAQFSGEYLLVRAPGRINLIGEHTDYNEGFVFPAAVGHEICFALGKSESDRCTLVSLDLDERFEFDLADLQPLPPNSWQNYLLGVAAEIIKTGKAIGGFNLVFSGNVPQGAGMSSSAALECGTCFGLNELFDLGIPKLEMIKLSQHAEHNYAGVKCGIMDQFASMMGKKNQAFTLDCRSLEHSHFPLYLDDYELLLINSNVSHNLASSEYNVRRQQCEEGVKLLNEKFGDIKALRDATFSQLEEAQSLFDPIVYLRCKYVLEENQRVQHFAAALQNQNFTQCGALLKQAQAAMKSEYQITCPEIDFLAEEASAIPQVLGARMVGGGFGGCTLNLIERGSQDQVVSSLASRYKEQFGLELTPISVQIEDGVGLE